MRKFCLALCFSIFASMIHAGSMPLSIDSLSQAHAEHVVKHDCHNQSDVKAEKSPATNHQTHHQCCLGVVANISSTQYIQPDFSNHLASQVPQLIIEAVPSHIFKPPKNISFI
jgi:hypothetical protein